MAFEKAFELARGGIKGVDIKINGGDLFGNKSKEKKKR